ncbi:hypothetical protein LZ554_006647 [Drepanopeziza brunnea f. sp. 'monogermtubi']|nr:hypothetical protein LZ554_006647 [Drepanopeziza brunnea f. sp. 'monogermtubi']
MQPNWLPRLLHPFPFLSYLSTTPRRHRVERVSWPINVRLFLLTYSKTQYLTLSESFQADTIKAHPGGGQYCGYPHDLETPVANLRFRSIHPIHPFPHQASFRANVKNTEDVRGPIFHNLLASMVGVLVASFTRKPVAFKKLVTVIGEPPRHTKARADARTLHHLISLGVAGSEVSPYHHELSIFEIMGYNQLRSSAKLEQILRLPNFRAFTESWALAAYSRPPSCIGGNTVAPIYSALTGGNSFAPNSPP